MKKLSVLLIAIVLLSGCHKMAEEIGTEPSREPDAPVFHCQMINGVQGVQLCAAD